MKRYLLLALVVLLALAVLRTASAQEATIPITILNPGFEDDVLSCAAGSTCSSSGSTGWLGAQSNAVKFSTVQFPSGIPGGLNVAAIGDSVSTGSILQTLGITVQAKTKYTLKLSVGARADYPFTGYNAALMAGNVTLAHDSSLSPGAGTFLTDVIVYNAGETPPQLGQPLQIFIQSKGTGQVAIDNVSLTATP